MSAVVLAASTSSYRGLRILLSILSIGAAIGGVWLLFATSSLSWLLPNLPGATDTLDLFYLKGIGAVALGLSYLAFNASRDPVRYVAVIDAIVIILILAVLLQIYEMAVHGLDSFYPYHLLLISTIGRALFAAVLLFLRPRVAS